MAKTSVKIWEKGYSLDSLIEEFTVDGDHLIDRELLPYDCLASAAHAAMLHRAGVLTADECRTLTAELAAIKAEADAGKHEIPRAQEDCHTYLEGLLIGRLGELGKKIHTARSRNDQVLTALRLFYRDRLTAVEHSLEQVDAALGSFAGKWGDTPLPGFTHMRKAMPSSVGLWTGAFRAAFSDERALLRAVANMADQCPAGTGAGYGVPLALDREGIARDLGFSRVQENPVYVQLSRGAIEASLLHVMTQILFFLNRLASDLILFSMPEFGYFRLPERFCTGSSIMPQKKNPDVLELMRAKYHEAVSLEFRVKTLAANLPSGYNRDLQLTKEPVMRGFRLVTGALAVAAHLLSGLEVLPERCREAMTPDLFATARVYDLVREGLPFREAYRRVAAELACGIPENAKTETPSNGPSPLDSSPDSIREEA
jgi:argininosuccinate lyase